MSGFIEFDAINGSLFSASQCVDVRDSKMRVYYNEDITITKIESQDHAGRWIPDQLPIAMRMAVTRLIYQAEDDAEDLEDQRDDAETELADSLGYN